jgi:hypothetical protein
MDSTIWLRMFLRDILHRGQWLNPQQRCQRFKSGNSSMSEEEVVCGRRKAGDGGVIEENIRDDGRGCRRARKAVTLCQAQRGQNESGGVGNAMDRNLK